MQKEMQSANTFAPRRIIAAILLAVGLVVGGSALATHPGWYSNTANGGVPGGMGT